MENLCSLHTFSFQYVYFLLAYNFAFILKPNKANVSFICPETIFAIKFHGNFKRKIMQQKKKI